MARLPDGWVHFLSSIDNVTVNVDTKKLVLCKHCVRRNFDNCPFTEYSEFIPEDNFYCALGEDEWHEDNS